MKIETMQELNKILKKERKNYVSDNFRDLLLQHLKCDEKIQIWKYLKSMRKANYFYYKRNNNFIYALLYIFYSNRFYRFGNKIGMICGEKVFGENPIIYHSFGTVINGNAIIGNNCKLYGNNCIGNNGLNNKCPKIGNNVRICVGAKVIGDVTIADNVTIAAGAVVTKDVNKQGIIVGGIPAKEIGNNNGKKYLK